MKNRYFKNNGIFVAINDSLEIWVQPSTGDFNITSESLGVDWYNKRGYTEINRTEFMEAYLPIAEKMNNKIGEL